MLNLLTNNTTNHYVNHIQTSEFNTIRVTYLAFRVVDYIIQRNVRLNAKSALNRHKLT